MGRRKGGLVSQRRRRNNPEYYKRLSCTSPNTFLFPEKSVRLEEFVGIVLGDGGLTKSQLHITLNSKADSDYVGYVTSLIEELFGFRPGLHKRRTSNAVVIVVTGVNFVDFLERIGLRVGNRVKQQVGVPVWVRSNRQFSKYCLRGLMDTDGGLFNHQYFCSRETVQIFKARVFKQIKTFKAVCI